MNRNQWIDLHYQLEQRRIFLEQARKEHSEHNLSNAFGLAATGVFVEKAQLHLSEHARLFAFCALALGLVALCVLGLAWWWLTIHDPAESGVKRNILGPCGKALAVSGNPGWGDGGRDASGAGGTGAAGRVEGRGAQPAGDRAGARPGGLDDQSGAAPQRPAERRLPAGARRGLLPRAPAAPGRPRARRAARPLRPRAPAGRLDPRADRGPARARRGARAPSGVARDDPRLRPPPGAEGREALAAAAARAGPAGGRRGPRA